MRAVEVREVARDVRGEARPHELLGGRGGPLLGEDRLAALREGLPGPAGAGLIGARRRKLGGFVGHRWMYEIPEWPEERQQKLLPRNCSFGDRNS